MEYFIKAYISAAIWIIVERIASLLNANLLINFIIMLGFFFLTAYFIDKDAKTRKLSSYHQLWALLSIIGVIIYHLGFARNKIKE
jgi:hypothetical protein